MKIGLRGGHSPNAKGAIGIIDEQECVRNLYYHVADVLRNYGNTVVDCNTDSSSVNGDLREGVDKANAANVDYFISLHMNASNGQGHGTEAWTYGANSRANDIAKRLVDNFSKLGFTNRGVKYNPSYYEMRNAKAPNIIFETLFCDNNIDVDIWNKTSWDTFSYAIANAIDPNIPMQPSNAQPPKPTPTPQPDPKPPVEKPSTDNNINANAVIQNDWLYVRDSGGNIINGRVDIGDKVQVLDILYSKQLTLMKYPTPNGPRTEYTTNATNCIKYLNSYNGKVNVSNSLNVRETPGGNVIGSLSKDEKVTVLEIKGDWVNVAYNTDKGAHTKSGWVSKQYLIIS